MQKLKDAKWLPALMVLTIMAIAAFQIYWLSEAYEREQKTLETRTHFIFRETVFDLQGEKLRLDQVPGDTSTKIIISQNSDTGMVRKQIRGSQKMVHMVDVIQRRARDSQGAFIVRGDDTLRLSKKNLPRRNRLLQFLFDVDATRDTIRIKEIEDTLGFRLKTQSLDIPFNVKRIPTVEREGPQIHEVSLGFSDPITYKLTLQNTGTFLLKRIAVPILFSIFLVGFTFLSFMLLYRNLLRERKLAVIKNDFISNITHELKTPIATVSVAIEALRSFNATLDPARTKEYLDISSNELQRLSLLVDKVLKLSMFEKKEIELRQEILNMNELVEEVRSSLRLQFEKKEAIVELSSEGDATVCGDRLHLVSIIFNLLDNALKYSPDKPRIKISVRGTPGSVQLSVTDSGIGISPDYHSKVFEKFFRVPTGNVHNAKGYGLGLSYVAYVVERHNGTIKLQSEEGKGSCFIITLPHQTNGAAA